MLTYLQQKIIEQEEKVEENTKTAVFSYDVVMVDGDKNNKIHL